jgi:PLD-like domain
MISPIPDRMGGAAIDLGSRTVPGWYWFSSGRRRAPYEPVAGTASSDIRHCFSYEGSQTSIKDAALELISGAREKIFLASFRFLDDDLRRALEAAAARLHGGVYVITAINDQDLKKTMAFTRSYEADEEDWWEAADPQADRPDVNAEEDLKHYQALIRSGIWVRGHPDFHAKFLVVDDRAALVSSANLESTALADARDRPNRPRGFDPVTGESGVVTFRPADADLLGRLFTRLWHTECAWDAPPGTGYELQKRKGTPSPCAVPTPAPGATGPIWTDAGEQLILDAIGDIARSARRDLLLATWSVRGLDEHPDLLYEPVRAALGRGVRVRMLMRSRNFAATRSIAGRLAAWGVEIYGDDKTHAKCAIADRSHGALFSANFDAEHGIYSGVEAGMRLDGQDALAQAAHFFEHCMEHAPQRLAGDRPAREVDTSLAARATTAWALPPELEVSCDADHWAALRETTGAVYYSTRAKGSITLAVQGGTWLLTRAGGPEHRPSWRMLLEQAPGPAGTASSTASGTASGSGSGSLDSWLEPPRRTDRTGRSHDGPRGLCPAVLLRP